MNINIIVKKIVGIEGIIYKIPYVLFLIAAVLIFYGSIALLSIIPLARFGFGELSWFALKTFPTSLVGMLIGVLGVSIQLLLHLYKRGYMIKIKHFTRTVKSSLLFDSRTSRVEYWHYVLFSSLLVFLMVIIGEIVTVTDVVVETYEGDARETLFAYSLLVFLPVIAASFRRLHDSNKSGRWLLLPFYNLYLLIRKGTVGPNFYGPDPKAAPLAIPVPPITDSPTV